ncbi:MAG TPA: LapA family protein, partial [Anaerolineae bacterium]|nr:LapA family protein [Anaerolineae bacterium]
MDRELADRIRAWLEGNPLAGVAIAFVIGLIVGWLALGWWLLPVRWVNAPPADLQPNYKEHYVAMVADSYHLSRDLEMARERVVSFREEELAHIMGKLHNARPFTCEFVAFPCEVYGTA